MLSQVLRSLLFGITPHDPLSFTIASGALLCVSLIASGIPALRATRVEAVRALRAN
jgi:ABC-type lipoprotein release transport system permease subunit